MPRPPHIDRILKLLLLGGRGNPSEQLRHRLRAAILEALGRHLDFADFFDHLAGMGIQASMATDDTMERIVYRWPPEFQVAIAAADLGEGCDWPSLLRAGLRFDPLEPRHRDARAMMAMT